MKKVMMIMVLGALMACLVPANAQTPQEWKSTSAMQTSGSTYTPQVTAVGATSVTEVTTTTDSYSPAKAPGGPHRVIETNNEWEEGDEGSPIGDAVLPLMLMALAFGGVVALRRRKALKS